MLRQGAVLSFKSLEGALQRSLPREGGSKALSLFLSIIIKVKKGNPGAIKDKKAGLPALAVGLPPFSYLYFN